MVGRPDALLTRLLCCEIAAKPGVAWSRVECGISDGNADTRNGVINGLSLGERGQLCVGTAQEWVVKPLLITAGRASNELFSRREHHCAVDGTFERADLGGWDSTLHGRRRDRVRARSDGHEAMR